MYYLELIEIYVRYLNWFDLPTPQLFVAVLFCTWGVLNVA